MPVMAADLVQHCNDVSGVAAVIAKTMNLSQSHVELTVLASQYHDIGKTLLPASIIDKPGSLTKEEFELIKLHVHYGSSLLSSSENDKLRSCRQYILYHHENWDGSGYLGLKGGEIPLISRIIRISDVYCALKSDRAYKRAMTQQVAVDIIKNEYNKFDPYILTVFLGLYEENVLNPIKISVLKFST